MFEIIGLYRLSQWKTEKFGKMTIYIFLSPNAILKFRNAYNLFNLVQISALSVPTDHTGGVVRVKFF